MAFGIYHTPEEFVAEAVKAGHPSQWSAVLPQVLEEAVDWNMKCTPKAVVPGKTQNPLKLVKPDKRFQQDEQDLHSSARTRKTHIERQKNSSVEDPLGATRI